MPNDPNEIPPIPWLSVSLTTIGLTAGVLFIAFLPWLFFGWSPLVEAWAILSPVALCVLGWKIVLDRASRR